jgi:hypothetical protein
MAEINKKERISKKLSFDVFGKSEQKCEEK